MLMMLKETFTLQVILKMLLMTSMFLVPALITSILYAFGYFKQFED